MKTTRGGLQPGEAAAVVRFAVVGVAATLVYLALSLVLLAWGAAPRLANVGAFAGGTAASYFGHYLFTYRSRAKHRIVGSRFAIATLALTALCVILHHLALISGATPQAAATVVAVAYPPLGFAANHFWVFLRGIGTGAASR